MKRFVVFMLLFGAFMGVLQISALAAEWDFWTPTPFPIQTFDPETMKEMTEYAAAYDAAMESKQETSDDETPDLGACIVGGFSTFSGFSILILFLLILRERKKKTTQAKSALTTASVSTTPAPVPTPTLVTRYSSPRAAAPSPVIKKTESKSLTDEDKTGVRVRWVNGEWKETPAQGTVSVPEMKSASVTDSAPMETPEPVAKSGTEMKKEAESRHPAGEYLIAYVYNGDEAAKKRYTAILHNIFTDEALVEKVMAFESDALKRSKNRGFREEQNYNTQVFQTGSSWLPIVFPKKDGDAIYTFSEMIRITESANRLFTAYSDSIPDEMIRDIYRLASSGNKELFAYYADRLRDLGATEAQIEKYAQREREIFPGDTVKPL